MTARSHKDQPEPRVRAFLDALAEILADRALESFLSSSGQSATKAVTTASPGEQPARRSAHQRLRRASTGSPNCGTLAS